MILYPQAMFKDPFRPNADNILVMCDCYTPAGDPIESNTRANAAKICKLLVVRPNPSFWASAWYSTHIQRLFFVPVAAHPDEEPWFGLEQEFTLFNLDEVCVQQEHHVFRSSFFL